MCDGDTSLVINDKLLVSIAKRNMQNIVPLAYELKKAQPQLLSNEAMYDGMVAAYKGGSIGPLSNDITKVWNSGQIGQEQLNVVKWLTYIVNQNIDYSKTLWKVDPPEEVKELIRSYTKSKTPDFFIYAKDKSKNQVEQPNNSVMNRIGAKIPNSKIHFSTRVGKFDYRLLMNPETEFELYPESNIIKSYDFWNARLNKFIVDKSMKNQDLYKYRCLREKVIEETGKNINFIVNTLVFYLYTVRKTSAKKGLWDGFGDILLENLKSNVAKLGNICPVCGKRFDPVNSLHTVCSDECRVKYNKLYMGKYRADVRFCKRDETPQTVAAQGIEQKYSKKNETNRGE